MVDIKHPLPPTTPRAVVLCSRKTLNCALYLFHHLVSSVSKVKWTTEIVPESQTKITSRSLPPTLLIKFQGESELYEYDSVKMKVLKVVGAWGYKQ